MIAPQARIVVDFKKNEVKRSRTSRSQLGLYILLAMFHLSSANRRITITAFVPTTSSSSVTLPNGCPFYNGDKGRVGQSRSDSTSSISATSIIDSRDENGVHEKTKSGLYLPSHPNLCIKSVMAPMVAASDYPFRQFLRKHCGVDLTYTQMIHSKKYLADPTFRLCHMDLYETGVTYANFVSSQLECLGELPIPKGPAVDDNSHDAPVIVQLAGDDPDTVVRAASTIMDHTNGRVSGFDLNCGCPQAIAKKGNYGAFLMERDSDKVCEILSALRRSLPGTTAVSAKIRLPVDDETLQRRMVQLVESGIQFLTIHGRTLHENKTKVGACRLDRIKLAVETAKKVDRDFPIIANGGIEYYEDVGPVLESTGAVAVMSSEALLETPNLFLKSSKDLTPRQRLGQQVSFAREYLKICAEEAPPVPGVLGMKKYGSFNVVRGHLIKFLHRYLTEQPDLRNRFTSEDNFRTLGEANQAVDELEDRYQNMSDAELGARSSGPLEASWYRRHRRPERRVHQKNIGNLYSQPKPTVEVSMEERKKQIQERLRTMKNQRKSTVGSRFI